MTEKAILEKSILAGGCFWGMQDLIRRLPGVVSTRVGYTGGTTLNPTYRDICSKTSGHAEAIEAIFNPAQISYRSLLLFFFQIHDPTTIDQQGNDRGSQYRSAIFYADDTQKVTAQQVINDINACGKWPGKIVTDITPAQTFYAAEDEHQDYLEKHPNGYTCHFIRPNWKV